MKIRMLVLLPTLMLGLSTTACAKTNLSPTDKADAYACVNNELDAAVAQGQTPTAMAIATAASDIVNCMQSKGWTCSDPTVDPDLHCSKGRVRLNMASIVNEVNQERNSTSP